MFTGSKKAGFVAASLSLLSSLPSVQAQNNQLSTSTSTGSKLTGYPPCDVLISAGLEDRVILATSDEYEPRVQTWWAANARYRPWCFVLPQTTEEVATTVNALRESGLGAGDWHIAVKSGGHGFPGGSNIANGVTIDLGMMNSSTYDADSNVASIQSGARWGKAYLDLLNDYNVTVAGGRFGDVGVGGLLLGGGISYYTGRHGLACDTVINYEVVLADGSIVEANINENPDMFRALKGSGLNLGIVTRYDMLAIPAADLALGSTVFLSNYSGAVSDALSEFTDSQEQFSRDDAFLLLKTHNTASGNADSIQTLTINTQGNLNSSSFDRLTQIPSLTSTWELTSHALAAGGPTIERGITIDGITATFLNTPSMLRQSLLIHDEVVSTLSEAIGTDNFITVWLHQPLPSYYSTLWEQNEGGVRNILGLERLSANAILWAGSISVTNPGDAPIARAVLIDATRRLQEVAITEGAEVDFKYLNYAFPSQDPLGSYGSENAEFLRDVATRYDPEGFWQQRVPGGFKISRVVVEEA